MAKHLLYAPPSSTDTPTHKLFQTINTRYSPSPALKSYEDAWNWSTQNIGHFWNTVWDQTGVIGQKGSAPVVDETATPADNPDWFSDARLNWAQNMLRTRSDKPAIVQTLEPYTDSTGSLIEPPTRRISYNDLYTSVVRAAQALRARGVKLGDVVGSYSSNNIENIILSLATSALGAIWTSAAADFGPQGVLERFEQVKPSVILSVDTVSYNGKLHPHLSKLSTLVDGLKHKNCAPKSVIVVPFDTTNPPNLPTNQDDSVEWTTWDAFMPNDNEPLPDFEFVQTPFNHPLWILFSSGTTGLPKPIVHRAGGMLLQSLKELVLCAHLEQDDVFFYYTSTGWMMWNFLVGALAIGCTIVLFDGSPLRESSRLWKIVEEEKVSIFGTSAKYLEVLSKKYTPNEHHDTSTLRQLYSTGSPLAPQLFDYVYTSIASKRMSPSSAKDEPNKTLLLASITGGTDICSLFAGFNATLPVYRGEIQCRMLAMAIRAVDDAGNEVPPGEQGELVCTRPFPCQPLGFWPLPGYGTDERVAHAHKRYMDAYFTGVKGYWYHGDHVMVTPSREGNGGGVIMLGRSDGVLNPGGIRFGSAEIYQVLEECFSDAPAHKNVILDALCIGQKLPAGEQGAVGDERVLLFVKLPEGQVLDDGFIKMIAKEIRTRRSARHVPALCIQVHDIPYTLNGKKVEVPVRKILDGAPLSSINQATLRNPECLTEYIELAQKLKPGADGARL